MADIDIPFNRDPVSTTTQTTSYTIPADQYARVTVTKFGSDFKLDSVVEIHAHNQSSAPSLNSAGAAYTNDTGETVKGSMTSSISGGSFDVYAKSSGVSIPLTFPGTAVAMQIQTAGVQTSQVELAPGQEILINDPDTGTLYLDLSIQNYTHATEFWVPTGTLVEGEAFTVELYNSIT